MQYCKNTDLRMVDYKVNGIRKTTKQGAPCRTIWLKIELRILLNLLDSKIDLVHKLNSESYELSFIPPCCLFNINRGLWFDNNTGQVF